MVEHRVEDVLKIHPEQVIYMSGGQILYHGTAEGLDESINYRDVKLPRNDHSACEGQAG